MNTRESARKKYGILQKAHLLIVEDDRFSREQLGLLLSRFVGRLTAAEDGVEGLERFRRDRPDIVVTDINMPRMDGLAMATAIKAEDAGTPVIMVTAHSDTEFFLRSIEIGIDGYVVKPVEMENLLRLLSRHAAALLETRAREARGRLFQFTLDINPNFILSLHAGEVDYVNRTFLDFLGAASLADLTGGPHAGRQLEIDGRLHQAADFSWASLVGDRADVTHQAVFPPLPGDGGQRRTFLVSSANFPELDRRVLTFTDITPLEEERRELILRASTDALTGIANRAGLSDVLRRELHRVGRYETMLSVIMFDIDRFKAINDTYGHQAGDAVLVALTRLVSDLVRDVDTFGRFGGEEFLIVAPMIEDGEGEHMAERLRSAIEAARFPAAGTVTCSFGVAQWRPDDTVESLIGRADAALYRAKATGRNRVVGT